MTRTLKFTVLLSAAVLAACGENAVQEIHTPLQSEARIKFFNFGTSAPGVHFYAGTQKISAISSTTNVESTAGTAQGGVSNGGFYSALTPGDYAFTAKIAATTDKDLTISTVNQNVGAGKFYTFFTSGIYNTTAKSVESFIIEDPVPANFDFTQAQVRFVNAIPNSQPQVLWVRNTVTGVETAVGATGVAYKAGSAFVGVAGAVYDFRVTAVGGTTNLYVRTGVSLIAGRVMTIAGRGDMTVTSTTSANRPQLDATANR
jgi:hypothetical protein